jgi:DNA-directed RNA polymerase specialized sigma24 family protein
MNALMATKIKQQDKDETKLVRHAITDVDAFAELYRRHLTRVYRYHMAHIGNVKDAEDLTSQTFMAVLEGIRSFRGNGSFAAWIMGIASKKRLMFFRRNGSRPEIPLDAALQIQAWTCSPTKLPSAPPGIRFPRAATDFPGPIRSDHPDVLWGTLERRSGTRAQQK